MASCSRRLNVLRRMEPPRAKGPSACPDCHSLMKLGFLDWKGNLTARGRLFTVAENSITTADEE